MFNLMLDAGHGANTPGKRSPNGMKEFEFNKAVALKVEEMLKRFEGVAIHRLYDVGGRDVPLKERTDKANTLKNKAGGECAVVSIHANAYGSGWNSADGVETYSWDGHSPNGDALAAVIHKHMIRETGRDDRGHKKANFHMVREPVMASALVECEFMTNKEAAALLLTDSYRKKCATAIVNALVEHYHLKAKPQPKAVVNDGVLYRVVTGSFDNRDNAEQRMKELEAKGFDSFLLPYKK